LHQVFWRGAKLSGRRFDEPSKDFETAAHGVVSAIAQGIARLLAVVVDGQQRRIGVGERAGAFRNLVGGDNFASSPRRSVPLRSGG
jgi:hypothetical protein